MSRRTFEGPMDWEYQNSHGPLDMSSPFSQVSKQPHAVSPTSRSAKIANPFASLSSNIPPQIRHPSPSKQQFPRPPSSSIFNAPVPKQYPYASPFRNPAFTTPQKRAEDVLSEYSAAEESPAVASDASEFLGDTPDHDTVDKNMRSMMITTESASATNRKLFADNIKSSGRGEVPRGSQETFFSRRDKVRKRKRLGGDKDVGSVRARFCTASTSGEETDDTDGSEWSKDNHRFGKRKQSVARNGRQASRGIIGNIFDAIHEHPNVPLILSWWVQLGINLFLVSIFMWFIWGGISMMRTDISHAADAARSRLLAEMNACAHEYTKNRCAPKPERLPALNIVCDEWEICMNQDPSSVMKMQISAKNVAEIINEFVGAMSVKAWGFIISAMLAMVFASNLGFSRFREMAFVSHTVSNRSPQQTYPLQQAGAPMLPPSQDPNQAYIWAPIGQTPRHIRREFIADTPTDTDASPDTVRVVSIAASQSLRRDPSKCERGRSPTKGSPSKGY